jgi:hypothetical protein
MPDDVSSPATELHWLTIADAARLLERRRISPLELTDAADYPERRLTLRQASTP